MAETRFIEQDLLRLDTESTIVPYSYSTGEFSISITGGSGTGDYHWRIIPVSGLMTTSDDQMESHGSSDTISLKFVESGVTILTVYKDGSLISGDNYYIQSKTLEVELLLSEKEIKIVVDPETKVYPLGHNYSTSDFSITHPNTIDPEYNDVLSTKPSLYVPYELLGSDDFYRFDVFEKAAESGYSNGVQFINNNDGTWTIKGTPLGTAYYNLIVSDTKIPDYIFKLTQYKYTSSISSEPVSIQFIQYFPDDRKITTTLGGSDAGVVFSDTACGLVVRFKVTSTVDSTIAIHLYSFKDRYVDTNTESSYHVSASGGVVSDSVLNTYSKTLDYKSAKFKFENNVSYAVVDMGDMSQHTTTGLESSYYPKTDVIFTVKAKPNYYFVDGWSDISIKTSSEAYEYDSLWGPWWTDEDVYLCWGTGTSASDDEYFRIKSRDPYVTTDYYREVPFNRISAKFDGDGRLVEGTYWIKMPANSTELQFKFLQIYTTSAVLAYPFVDIYYSSSASGDASTVVLRDQSYEDAIKFCYNARRIYFPSESREPPIISSPYSYSSDNDMKFFRYYPSDYESSSNLDLYLFLETGDMINILRNMSHSKLFQDDTYSWGLYSTEDGPGQYKAISKNPDLYVERETRVTNNPQAIVSYYAGYPPKLDVNRQYNVHYPYLKSQDTMRWTSAQLVPYLGPANETTTRAKVYTYDSRGSSFSEVTAVSDFLTSGRHITDYSWGAWSGVVISSTRRHDFIYRMGSKYDLKPATNFNPSKFVYYTDAVETLWNYAKFRQFDVSTDSSYNPSSNLNSQFVSNPACLWALSRGLITGYRAPCSFNGSEIPSNIPIDVASIIYRHEWAYMISNFCQMYPW